MRIGFCGLGLMGAPMAQRLLGAGHDLTVWNRTAEKAEPVVSAGARAAGSPGEAAAGAEVVITMLASPSVLADVVFGDGGIAATVEPDATLIEMSTVGPDAVEGLARRLGDRVEIVDAPVLGSVPQVEDGSLTVFVGASDDTFGRLRPLLSVFGEPVHTGPRGSAAAIKLVVNSTLGALQLAFGEAMALSDALGVDPRTALDVLEGSAIGPTVKKKRSKLETGVFEPNFKLSLAAKDMRLVTEAARRAGIELRGAEAARAAFEAADGAGLGECDYSAVAAFLAGRPARPT